MKLRLNPSLPFLGFKEIAVANFPCVVGRSSGCDIKLPVMFVSRRHCRLTRVDGQVYVQDLESRNGTYVNGQRAERPLRLLSGDQLCLGPVPFTVELSGSGHSSDTLIVQLS